MRIERATRRISLIPDQEYPAIRERTLRWRLNGRQRRRLDEASLAADVVVGDAAAAAETAPLVADLPVQTSAEPVGYDVDTSDEWAVRAIFAHSPSLAWDLAADLTTFLDENTSGPALLEETPPSIPESAASVGNGTTVVEGCSSPMEGAAADEIEVVRHSLPGGLSPEDLAEIVQVWPALSTDELTRHVAEDLCQPPLTGEDYYRLYELIAVAVARERTLIQNIVQTVTESAPWDATGRHTLSACGEIVLKFLQRPAEGADYEDSTSLVASDNDYEGPGAGEFDPFL